MYRENPCINFHIKRTIWAGRLTTWLEDDQVIHAWVCRWCGAPVQITEGEYQHLANKSHR